jgi:acyl carrier protein
VERRATPLETDPVSTKQLTLPLTTEAPHAQTPLSVEDRVFRVIRGYAQGDFDLSAQTRLDSIFDSVGAIEVSIGLEGEFGFDFAEDHFEEWATINDVVKCVEKMLLSQGTVKPAPPVEHQRPGIW